MKQFKEIAVDLLVMLLIITAVLSKTKWITILIIAYTILILLMKLLVLFNPSIVKLIKPGKTPLWIFHLIYAINVMVLLVSSWWLLSISWGGIWLLSWQTQRKGSSMTSSRNH